MNEAEQKIIDDFDWPCHKRRAHGPHEWEVGGIGKPKYGQATVTCLGVKAHPLTQIGRVS